jgi:hypothetical protein
MAVTCSDRYALEPKFSTALSAANLRLKLDEHEKAAGAYRKVLAAWGLERGPTERERAMAERKLAEAEAGAREHAVGISSIERNSIPRPLEWFAVQLEELSEDLFSESATLYPRRALRLSGGL